MQLLKILSNNWKTSLVIATCIEVIPPCSTNYSSSTSSPCSSSSPSPWCSSCSSPSKCASLRVSASCHSRRFEPWCFSLRTSRDCTSWNLRACWRCRPWCISLCLLQNKIFTVWTLMHQSLVIKSETVLHGATYHLKSNAESVLKSITESILKSIAESITWHWVTAESVLKSVQKCTAESVKKRHLLPL